MAHSTKSYSDDLRRLVVEARLSGRSEVEISRTYQVSHDCVRRWVIQYRETGSFSSRRRGGCKKPKIADMAKFEAFARAHAHSTLVQMQAHWEEEVSLMCFSRALKRLGWTRKKKHYTYRECDEAEREVFLTELEKIPEHKRVWADETGMDSDESYPYGWARKGQRCEAQKHGGRTTRERVNLVAGLKQGKLLAPVIFNGYCDGNFFLEWLQKALIPEMQRGDVLILDNAPFHPKERIITLLQEADCSVLFLPRYSPRDNEIEYKRFSIKNDTRKILTTFSDIKAALYTVIMNAN